MRRAIVTLMFFLAGTRVLAQQPPVNETLVALERYRAQIEALESQLGRYDPGLVESLKRLAETTMALDQFGETDAVLDRAIQILRINQGLYTETQIPLLALSVRNNVRRGNWRDANEELDHLTWLYTMVPREQNSELVTELQSLGELHLEGVGGDIPSMKDSHLRSAESLGMAAVKMAESVWSPTDTRRIDLYYSQVLRIFVQFTVVNQGGPESMGLRQFIPGIEGMTRSRLEMERLYYGLGMDMFARMRKVYEQSDPPAPERLAMVELYEGDWKVLFDRGNPGQSYSRAYQLLVSAGIAEQLLRQYFGEPRLLPLDSFYASIEQAQLAVSTAANSPRKSATGVSIIPFVEWSPSMPNVEVPIAQPLLDRQEIARMNTASIAFTLDGLDRVRRWIRGRFLSQRSVADEYQWLNQTADQAMTDEELEERIHRLIFRPVLDKGFPQIFEGVLEYRYFPFRGD